MSNPKLNNIDMAMFHQTFFEESEELLGEFEARLLQLEAGGSDSELLNTIFRCAHSIKGGSATFGFTAVAHFTHGLETLLDRVRNGQVAVTSPLVALLLESRDQMQSLLDAARGLIPNAPDSSSLLARLQAASESGSPLPANQPGATKTVILDTASGETAATSDEGEDEFWGLFTDDEQNTDVTQNGGIAPDGEMEGDGWGLFLPDASDDRQAGLITGDTGRTGRNTNPEPRATNADAKIQNPKSKTQNPNEGGTLRVSTDKVDKLINLVGELVINQSMLNEVIQNFSMAKLPRLIEAVGEMERASRELQERVMAVRMLPIKHAFGRFPRLVHDLAASCGKRIELQMTGEETELDKTVIEAIGDPLTHLVRNSIDHGLETPDDRRLAGKPETGTIALHAFHEGGSIVIEISDDGRGLNRERILSKAVERGLLAEGETPPDDAINNLIFHPGFSTAPTVTDLSGRGVGMDIVKSAVQNLGGNITLATTPGQGTRFRIRLPLTMAILEGLSLSVGDEVYILPLTSIVESIRPKPGDVRMVAGRGEVVLVRGEVLPIVRLYQVFGARPCVSDPTCGLLVIVENENRKVALLVDELIGQSQVVIKSLESNYQKVPGIAGATILGDGRVALILDVAGLTKC